MTIKWFDRVFDFNLAYKDSDSICQRLTAAPDKIIRAVAGVDNDLLEEKKEGKWSVKEHVGHLSVLEPLWRERLLDIQQGRPQLTPADLQNTATDDAGFNNYTVEELTAGFAAERNRTIALLSQIDAKSVIDKSFHPRLKKEMGITDHLYFIAEHDDHHIAYIQEFLNRG